MVIAAGVVRTFAVGRVVGGLGPCGFVGVVAVAVGLGFSGCVPGGFVGVVEHFGLVEVVLE